MHPRIYSFIHSLKHPRKASVAKKSKARIRPYHSKNHRVQEVTKTVFHHPDDAVRLREIPINLSASEADIFSARPRHIIGPPYITINSAHPCFLWRALLGAREK